MTKAQWTMFDPLGTLQPKIEGTVLSVDGFRVAQVFRLRDCWRICYFDDSIQQVQPDVSQDAVRALVLDEALDKLRKIGNALADMCAMKNTGLLEQRTKRLALHS